jgi:hypothetical protein
MFNFNWFGHQSLFTGPVPALPSFDESVVAPVKGHLADPSVV